MLEANPTACGVLRHLQMSAGSSAELDGGQLLAGSVQYSCWMFVRTALVCIAGL